MKIVGNDFKKMEFTNIYSIWRTEKFLYDERVDKFGELS